jgi:hypothetical protein
MIVLFSISRHGDMLYLSPGVTDVNVDSNIAMETCLTDGHSSVTPVPAVKKHPTGPTVVEDEVDKFMSKQDGLIHRPMNPQL